MPYQRKSIEPMAARLGIEPQRLQQFMADSPWDDTELWRVIRREVVPHFEPIEAWIVDETGWLKQGKNSVGVAHQYCGTRIAWQEVFLARGLKEPQGQLEKLWLVVDWPKGAKAPYHCYLAHFHREPSKALCLKLSRSRWHVEQYFQRSKDDLGLDHYEGRSWRGFHHQT